MGSIGDTIVHGEAIAVFNVPEPAAATRWGVPRWYAPGCGRRAVSRPALPNFIAGGIKPVSLNLMTVLLLTDSRAAT